MQTRFEETAVVLSGAGDDAFQAAKVVTEALGVRTGAGVVTVAHSRTGSDGALEERESAAHCAHAGSRARNEDRQPPEPPEVVPWGVQIKEVFRQRNGAASGSA